MSPVIYVSPAFRTACGWVSKTDIVLFYCRPAL